MTPIPVPITKETIYEALSSTALNAGDAQGQMTPAGRSRRRPAALSGEGRIGAVLLLLYGFNGELFLVLTKRRDDLSSHAGQVSFPGGRQEPDEPLTETALRETEEEIGVPAAGVDLLGRLSPLYIPPSDFTVYPFVGWRTTRPLFAAQPAEVAEIIEVPLRHLLDPATRQVGEMRFFGQTHQVPYYRVGAYQVWGATAMMLSEFLARVRHVLGLPQEAFLGPAR
jgi:8-oxo-dGTP pyrophosphatase MutT (NUDIX family)